MLEKLESIKWKILVVYIGLIFGILIFAGFFVQRSLQDYFTETIQENLIKELNLVSGLIEEQLKEDDYEQLNRSINRYGEDLEKRITVMDIRGEVLADSQEDPARMENHLYRPEVQEVLTEGIGKEIRYSSTVDREMKYVAIPIIRDNQTKEILRIAINLEELWYIYIDIWVVLFRAGIIAILISLFLALKLITKITDPIRSITWAAERIANGYLDQNIVVNTNDEVGRLASMFNHMVNKVKEKVEEISNEKNKVEAIVTSIGDGVIAIDNKGKIILFNSAAQKIFGIKEEEVLNKSIIQVTKNHKLDELMNRDLRDNQFIMEEIEILLPQKRIFRVQIAPIKGQQMIVGAVGVLRDVTELRRLEQMRTEFVGNVSHELKTPLTSIKGYVETLLDTKPDYETYDSFLNIVSQETNRLDRLIGDLLELSKIESKSDYFVQEDIDIVTQIANTICLLEDKAAKKGIDIVLDLSYEYYQIKGNKDQISRLLINLVDNAIKYTPEGGQVRVGSYLKDNSLVIEVEDDGIGIPQKDLPRVFERFYRVDKARARKLGGTGLGLSIVKHIVEDHKGKIEVESEVDKGTKFIIELTKV
ncbi:two-component system histidine kinase PnpS [Halonatronum saccharophilum]|uniref:two-component system histidine kinase PnpS n=1 Tax=Halonatronum saccharophilum TaxID=150060 RepID=UPI00048205DB|nr:ATP-binding protein [Halonatronum saccharophilum]